MYDIILTLLIGWYSRMINFFAYHGTDLERAKEIVKSDFIYKHNSKHWLGNGVYFYLDYSLAKWWTTNPSKMFGTKINTESIIQVEIEIDENDILDLRILEDYKEFSDIYYNEFIPEIDTGILGEINSHNYKKVRCSFCDYLKNSYDLKCIIGNFDIPSQRYIPNKCRKLSDYLKLHYIETQVCLFDTQLIKTKTIIE